MQGRTWCVNMEIDEDISAILDKLARKYSSRPIARLCCSMKLPIGYEIRSGREIEELKKNCRVLFVNFYSTYCPYCKIFHKVFIDVGRKYRGRAGFIKLNVDYDIETAWKYNIMSTPSTIAFVDGKPVTLIPGYVPHETFEMIVRRVLSEAGCA